MTENREVLPRQSATLTRDELIALCEAASRSESAWHDRDSARAQRQIGEAWALLRAGCEFSIDETMEDFGGKTIWIRIVSKGFQFFEWGDDEFKDKDTFYIPTRHRLDEAGEGDWY